MGHNLPDIPLIAAWSNEGNNCYKVLFREYFDLSLEQSYQFVVNFSSIRDDYGYTSKHGELIVNATEKEFNKIIGNSVAVSAG